MVLNILSFVFAIVGIFVAGLPCGIAAVVLGIIGVAKQLRLKGLGIAGMIIGIIDIIIIVVYAILLAMGVLVV